MCSIEFTSLKVRLLMTNFLQIKRNSALSLLVILALGLGLLISVKIAAHASGSAAITLSPAFGPPTTPVTVSGTGFGAIEGVTITFEANQVATATTDATGAFSASFTVSKLALPGNRPVKATGTTSQLFKKLARSARSF